MLQKVQNGVLLFIEASVKQVKDNSKEYNQDAFLIIERRCFCPRSRQTSLHGARQRHGESGSLGFWLKSCDLQVMYTVYMFSDRREFTIWLIVFSYQ